MVQKHRLVHVIFQRKNSQKLGKLRRRKLRARDCNFNYAQNSKRTYDFFWDKVLYSFSLSLILNQADIQN